MAECENRSLLLLYISFARYAFLIRYYGLAIVDRTMYRSFECNKFTDYCLFNALLNRISKLWRFIAHFSYLLWRELVLLASL